MARPGRYYLAPNSTIADLLAQAGGLTSGAYVYGTEFDRVSVRQQQQAGFDHAISNFELAVAASPLALSGIDASEAGAQAGRAQMAQAAINQLKMEKPDGRMVLPITPEATELPGDLKLENDDSLLVPPAPSTVGVFGAVFQQGSFLYRPGRSLSDYLRLAGGTQRIAENGDIFVIRANGAVVSKRQHAEKDRFDHERALPGDVIFVPIKTTPNLWWQRLVQISTILGNLGLAAAAVDVLAQQ